VRNGIWSSSDNQKKEEDIPTTTRVIEFLKRYYLLQTLCICTLDDGFRLTCRPAPGTEANVYPSPTRPLAWRGRCSGGGDMVGVEFTGKGLQGVAAPRASRVAKSD